MKINAMIFRLNRSMMYKHSLLFCVFIFLFSCTKTKNRTLTRYTKYAVNIDSGSVFVYRDSITGMLDTFNVTSNSGVKVNYFNTSSLEEDPYFVETMDYSMSSLKLGMDEIRWDINIKAFAPSSIYGTFLLFDSLLHYTYRDHRARIYSEPFTSDSNNLNTGQEKRFETQLNDGQYPRYTLHGKEYLTVFENVHTYQNTFSLFGTNKDTTIYYQTRTLFSLDSGLIKFSIRSEKEYRVKELIYSDIKRKYPL